MGLRINLNTSALSAHRYLSESDGTLSKSIEHLSSGYKINSAGDDPAGMVISEKLRSQISGLGQAISNAGDAVNMVKTAEGALNEVHRLLRSMRDLAVHAANTGATDTASAQADQAQINNAILSINRIAKETQFGKRSLLDGSAGIRARIDGTAVMSGDFSYTTNLEDGIKPKVNITQAAEKANLVSANTYGTKATATGARTYNAVSDIFDAAGGVVTLTLKDGRSLTSAAIVAGDNVTQALAKINTAIGASGLNASFDAVSKQVVITGSEIGMEDSFRVQYSGGSAVFASDGTYVGTNGTFSAAAGYMYINGIKIDFTDGESVDQFVQRVNAKTSLHGSVASINETTNKIELKSQEYGSDSSISVTSASAFLGAGVSSSNAVGKDIQGNVTYTDKNGVENAVSDSSWNKGKGLILKDSLGNSITMRESFGSVIQDLGTQFELGVNSLKFQVGAYEGQVREISIGSSYAEDLGRGVVEDQNVSTMDVSTYQGAVNALKIIDNAITDISTLRASLGATQKNVLESSISSLTIAKENIASSESSIRDTDMAAEILNMTKNQILQQSGISMLAQANQMPQNLLKLLQ